MKVLPVLLLLSLTLLSCKQEQRSEVATYPDQFGEIVFDATQDDPAFRLCDSSSLVHSRTSLSYEGGRQRIVELCKATLQRSGQRFDFDGYVVVRFLVNCEGKVGRLRVESLDDGFVQKQGPEALIEVLRQSVSSLNEWTITKPANEGKDHSKYLNFKIKNGQIDAIIH